MSMTSCIDRAAPVATFATVRPAGDGQGHIDDGAGGLVDRHEIALGPQVAQPQGRAGSVADLLDQFGQEVRVGLARAVQVEQPADGEVDLRVARATARPTSCSPCDFDRP